VEVDGFRFLIVQLIDQSFSLLMESFKLVLKCYQIRLEHFQKIGIRHDFFLEVIEFLLCFGEFAFNEFLLFEKRFLSIHSVRVDLFHQLFKQVIVCYDSGKLIKHLLLRYIRPYPVWTAYSFPFVVVLSAIVVTIGLAGCPFGSSGNHAMTAGRTPQ